MRQLPGFRDCLPTLPDLQRQRVTLTPKGVNLLAQRLPLQPLAGTSVGAAHELVLVADPSYEAAEAEAEADEDENYRGGQHPGETDPSGRRFSMVP